MMPVRCLMCSHIADPFVVILDTSHPAVRRAFNSQVTTPRICLPCARDISETIRIASISPDSTVSCSQDRSPETKVKTLEKKTINENPSDCPEIHSTGQRNDSIISCKEIMYISPDIEVRFLGQRENIADLNRNVMSCSYSTSIQVCPEVRIKKLKRNSHEILNITSSSCKESDSPENSHVECPAEVNAKKKRKFENSNLRSLSCYETPNDSVNYPDSSAGQSFDMNHAGYNANSDGGDSSRPVCCHTFQCDICNFISTSKPRLVSHLKFRHPDIFFGRERDFMVNARMHLNLEFTLF